MAQKREIELNEEERVLRGSIYKQVEDVLNLQRREGKFTPGRDLIRYAGAVYDREEIVEIFDTLLDGWFGVGKRTQRFEKEFAQFLGVKHALMTNSGSSANLLAVSALCSIDGERRLRAGDEVITIASTFPTTLNPIIQNGLTPVFVDIDLGTYNASSERICKAFSPKTKAIMVPHTMGNPNEMDTLRDFSNEKEIMLIEDVCDALGSKYDGRALGSFGDFSTFSFYPAHHITTGEGGAVTTNDDTLHGCVLSLRDWGRNCIMPVCNPQKCTDTECPKSISYKHDSSISTLPDDYDKRYSYSHIGYNLRPMEIQAAMGIAQLKKLPNFIRLRKKNFQVLYEVFNEYEEYFILPTSLPKSDPCWFAFPLTVRREAPFKRRDLMQWLTKNLIEVKMLFTGNILVHPAYKEIKYRQSGALSNSDIVLNNSFFMGVYPGIDEEQMKYVLDIVRKFISKYR